MNPNRLLHIALAAVGFLTVTSMGVNGYLLWRLRTVECNQSRLTETFTTITDHNNAVKAQNAIFLSVSNLSRDVGQLDSRLQEVATVTNIYPKFEEFEHKLADARDEQRERQQQLGVARLVGKVDALEKGMIRMSVALQHIESQQMLPEANTNTLSAAAPPEPAPQQNP